MSEAAKEKRSTRRIAPMSPVIRERLERVTAEHVKTPDFQRKLRLANERIQFEVDRGL